MQMERETSLQVCGEKERENVCKEVAAEEEEERKTCEGHAGQY